MTDPTLTPWPDDKPQPDESRIEAIFQQEGLRPRRWFNGPGDRYGRHSHHYHKVLFCARGSIRFETDDGAAFDLRPGDRLDIPRDVAHSAVVGPEGVTCLEAPRYPYQ